MIHFLFAGLMTVKYIMSPTVTTATNIINIKHFPQHLAFEAWPFALVNSFTASKVFLSAFYIFSSNLTSFSP